MLVCYTKRKICLKFFVFAIFISINGILTISPFSFHIRNPIGIDPNHQCEINFGIFGHPTENIMQFFFCSVNNFHFESKIWNFLFRNIEKAVSVFRSISHALFCFVFSTLIRCSKSPAEIIVHA